MQSDGLYFEVRLLPLLVLVALILVPDWPRLPRSAVARRDTAT
jgi:hypothetical protein